MITETYRGHTLTNAVSAIVIYYPKITNGGDLAKDLQEKNSLTTLGMTTSRLWKTQLVCQKHCMTSIK